MVPSYDVSSQQTVSATYSESQSVDSSLVVPSSPHYTIAEGPKGRGLFAVTSDIELGALLHVAPTIVVSLAEYEQHMKYTILEHYLFKDKRSGNMLLALGHGSLFNHSKYPNVDYRIAPDGSCIRYYASSYRPILNGDELCISYGSDLWFDDASDGESGAKSEDGEAEVDAVSSFLTRIQLDEEGDERAD